MLGRLLYSPFLAQLVVIRRCNLSCTYCNEFDDHSPPVETAELKARLEKLRELGTWAVDFTGGEPLLHPDIFELIRFAKRDLKFHKVMLLSNGYKFSREVVDKLNDAGLDALQISVDGVEPNDVTVKVLKPLRKKLMCIAEGARFETTLSGVIGSAPAGEATEVVKFARDNGFTPRVLLIHDGDGQLKLSPEQLAEFREVAELIGTGFKESRGYRDKLIESGRAPFKCRAGSRYLYVDEFGAVHWCSQMRGEWTLPLADYSRAVLKQQFYTKKPCNEHCTVGCARTSSSPDEWRRQHLSPDLSGSPDVVPADRLGAKVSD